MSVAENRGAGRATPTVGRAVPRRGRTQAWMTAATICFVGLAGWAIFFSSNADDAAAQKLPPLEIDSDASESERIEKIDQWLLQLQQDGKFNGGVLIARDGKPLLMKAYGFADAKSTRPLTIHTPFRLASVSKQFTAAGILRLAEQGRVELDQLASKCLQGFPYANVSVRHLLNQTAGIPDAYIDLARTHRGDFGEALQIQDVVELLRRYPPTAKAPGDEYNYSNTNYVLLAAIVESVSGEFFEDFMQQELFEPLGMKDTRVFNRMSTRDFPERAEDYEVTFGWHTSLPMTWIDGVAGDGGVFCSLSDFLTWNEFWNGNALVSDELLSQAFVRPKLNDGTLSDYGFGWIVYGEEKQVWHNGSWLGARTYIMRDPVSKRCLVLLDNSHNDHISKISRSIERQLLKTSSRSSDAPRVSPFTEVRFRAPAGVAEPTPAEMEVIVTYEGQTYQWLELDGVKVDAIVETAKAEFDDDWRKRVAEDLVDILWRMDHRPAETVELRLLNLETKQEVVIENASMNRENRSKIYRNRLYAEEEAAYNKDDDEAEASKLKVDQELRARLIGRYQLNPNFIFRVQDRDGHLLVGITNQTTQEVFPDSPTRWSYRRVEATLEFKLGMSGPAQRLTLHQNGVKKHAFRIEE